MYKFHVSLLIYLCSYANSSSLPSFITPCLIDQDDQSLSQCILEEARRVQKPFTRGIPELGIEALDPLLLGNLDIGTGAINIRQSNLIVKGMSKLNLKEIKMNRKASSGRIVGIGNLTVTSDFDIDGRLLLLPLNGKGKLRIKMVDTEIVMKYKTKLVQGADGKQHVFMHDIKNTHTFGDVHMRLDGLLGNDKTIGEAVNQILNDNWRELMKDFGPPSVNAVSNKTVGIMNDFYSKVPYEEMFSHK